MLQSITFVTASLFFAFPSSLLVSSLSVHGSIPQPDRTIWMHREETTTKNNQKRSSSNPRSIAHQQATKTNIFSNRNTIIARSQKSSSTSSTSLQASMSSSPPPKPTFPTQALLPKAETKADSFVAKYPKYDGSGITVGILDTGVDPGAIGLSTLPNGERKLVHVVDCTGSGDVGMNVETVAVKKDHGWVIEKNVYDEKKEIVLNPDLNLQPFPERMQEEKDAPTTETKEDETSNDETKEDVITMPVRLGFKRLYELFPKKLRIRMKAHHAKKFKEQLHQYATEVHEKLALFNSKFGGKELTHDQKREKDDLLARLEVLEEKLSDSDPLSNDPGPLCQIISFYDGKDYRVIIDLDDKDGDLSDVPVSEAMTDFYKEGQYGTFSHVDMLNYAINIYQEGKVVSIVVDAGAHGSHVAGITARYQADGIHKDDEEPNGVAPGAKLISFKIGDTRLGSMETGAALTRALIEAVKHKCDVINLSYGEGCVLPNTGRFIKLAEELVHKHGIVFVSSAGNNGPALTTVGAPGGTSDAIFGVAAYVSPAMMEAEYCAPKDDNEGTTYTWSSVGPTADGAQGPDFMAPGAAITCVPNWCLQRNQLMNGTSMSSPNAAGCVALLLSAAKAEGMKVTPARLKRALMTCAADLNGLSVLQQGAGMINVEKTWEYLKQHQDDSFGDINFKVRVLGRPGMVRGVYLRQPEETTVKQTLSVNIDPIFGTEDNSDAEFQQQRIEFEMKTALEASEPWVEVPDYFMLMHNGRSFKFTVDPTNLAPGVHTAMINGYDVNNKDAGPRFSVPITVTKPLAKSTTVSLGELEFENNEVKRYFLDVPEGASWMDVTVKDGREQSVDKETSARLVVLHTIQLLPHNAYRDAEVQKYLNLLPAEETVTSIPVHPGITCELALARYWSAQGLTNVKVDVAFRGVTASPDELTIIAGGDGAKTRLLSSLTNQDIKPEAKLTKWKTPISPKKSTILPCDERDIIPSTNKQIYQLVLDYEFEQKEEGSFTPRVPALQGYIYESAFESQLMLIFDEDKKYLGVADSWPDAVKAPKGKITIRLQVRHDDVKKLELLKDSMLWIERNLKSNIALSAYASHANMVTDGLKMRKRTLRKGTTTAVFFKEPAASKLPSDCKTGDVLTGSATFEDSSGNLSGLGKKPDGAKIAFLVGSKADSKDKDDKIKTPEVSDERPIEEKMAEELRSAELAQLKKWIDKDDDVQKFESYYKTLIEKYPDHVPLLMLRLKFDDKKDKSEDELSAFIKAADDVIAKLDEKAIAAHFGMNHDEEDADSVKERKEMKENKAFLIEAIARKAHANMKKDDKKDFEQTLKHLSQWEDIEKEKKYAAFNLQKYEDAKQYGLMLKLLNSLLEKKGEDTKDGIAPMTKDDIIKKRIEVLKSLNYINLAERDETWSRAMKATKEFALF